MTETNIVSVSGGKDSTATLLLAIERGVENIRAVFADTGNEHDLTYEYLDYLRERLGIPIEVVRAEFRMRIAKKREYIMLHWADDGVPDEAIRSALDSLVVTGNPFLDMCIWKGRFPSSQVRFCTEELKVIPLTEQIMLPAVGRGEDVWSWQGVRADESRARSQLPEQEQGEVGETVYRPIIAWTVEDVFAMHRKHNVEPNPLYKLGMGRVGCMPCIMARKGELSQIFKRFPDVVERLRRWESIVARSSKRGLSTFFRAVQTEPGVKTWFRGEDVPGIDAIVRWAHTARGGRQEDFLNQEEPASCSSLYGLCE